MGGNLNSFQDLGTSLVYGGGTMYHQMLLHIRKNSRYELGVGISINFEVLSHFLFKGEGITMYGHD
jgi:hypothetical protein